MKIMKCAKLGWTERQHSCTDNCPDNIKPTQMKQYTYKILKITKDNLSVQTNTCEGTLLTQTHRTNIPLHQAKLRTLLSPSIVEQ